ncbi:CBU_0592 family membrane protein [Xanthomarina spongicola]|jgi:hypothetical protein|uniref:CBU-0592-like domain-containing protein n=1 Tax=Xanthomarina spongicola TaxID=570520 RepID=A0A316DME7_9FLAO|nr:hypothetical protein [Xanthomarina spongicola]PWK18738.1 hypothetical protein LX78_02045 [Xanthomarina spongicola]
MILLDWIGFIGVFLILLAYFLNVTGRLKNTDLPFILLNLIGAGIACLASVLLKYIPFILLEGAWTLISINMLFKYFKNN